MREEGRVVLVEDNPNDIELTLRSWSRHPRTYPVHVLRDGQEALDFLFREGQHEGRAAGEPPKLILLDLKLPKVDGLEVLRRIKEDPRTRMIPVVVFSSSNQEADLLESYKLGVNSFVQKPIDFTAFQAVVKQLQPYWMETNQVASNH